MGRKFPFGEGGAGSPSNTKSPGLRPISIPSDTLIHAAIWPQQIWAENLGSLWWERFVKEVGLEPGVKDRELWMVRVVS